jgi:hypothetical protein
MADIEQTLLTSLTAEPNFVFKPVDDNKDSSAKRTVCVRNYSITNASGTPIAFFDKDLDGLFGRNLYLHGDVCSWEADDHASAVTPVHSFANLRVHGWCVLMFYIPDIFCLPIFQHECLLRISVIFYFLIFHAPIYCSSFNCVREIIKASYIYTPYSFVMKNF